MPLTFTDHAHDRMIVDVLEAVGPDGDRVRFKIRERSEQCDDGLISCHLDMRAARRLRDELTRVLPATVPTDATQYEGSL